MSCDWEGNRRSGVGLAMRHRVKWFIHLRAHGLSRGNEHPTNTLRARYGTLYLYLSDVELLNDCYVEQPWHTRHTNPVNPSSVLCSSGGSGISEGPNPMMPTQLYHNVLFCTMT